MAYADINPNWQRFLKAPVVKAPAILPPISMHRPTHLNSKYSIDSWVVDLDKILRPHSLYVSEVEVSRDRIVITASSSNTYRTKKCIFEVALESLRYRSKACARHVADDIIEYFEHADRMEMSSSMYYGDAIFKPAKVLHDLDMEAIKQLKKAIEKNTHSNSLPSKEERRKNTEERLAARKDRVGKRSKRKEPLCVATENLWK